MKFTFNTSHGNLSVERGLSVNDLILENNMKAETIIAHYFIKDSVIPNEISPHIFEMNTDLKISVKKARVKCQRG